jgi:large subunit ribosomal protein L20
MTRVKRGVNAHKKREKALKAAKGFRWGRKNKEKLAHEALVHAWDHMFHGRKKRKRDFRGLWNVRIGAAAVEAGMKYSTLINALKKHNVKLDRKILSDLAENEPAIFKAVVEKVRV